MNLLNVSGSPHVYTDNSVKKIMYGVVYAMMPALLVSIYFFGHSMGIGFIMFIYGVIPIQITNGIGEFSTL